MEELYEKGKIKAIGVSNFDPDQLAELIRLREHADYHIAKCSSGCSCCDEVENGADLVDFKMWKRANTIAAYILPKLAAINPNNPI